jgi:NAD(P)-dependent dehydrogenase (short-subunit alcohol dehydrogenase family)
MGSVLVHRFLTNGDIVIATDIKGEPLEELRERHNADALITTVGDISKERDCATLAELLRSKTTRVDVGAPADVGRAYLASLSAAARVADGDGFPGGCVCTGEENATRIREIAGNDLHYPMITCGKKPLFLPLGRK